MQRASPKVEKPKEEEIKLEPDDGFSSLASVSRKWYESLKLDFVSGFVNMLSSN